MRISMRQATTAIGMLLEGMSIRAAPADPLVAAAEPTAQFLNLLDGLTVLGAGDRYGGVKLLTGGLTNDVECIHVGYNAPMRRFRFSLLALLVVLIIAAVAIVWGQQWIELQRLRAEHRALLEANIKREESAVKAYSQSLRWRKQIGGSSADTLIQDQLSEHEGQLTKLKKSLSDLD